MKKIILVLVCLFLLIGTARAIPPFPPGGTCSSAGCGLTTGSWATYFASTFLPMSGVYTAGHLLGMDATDTYIVDVGAPVTDNSTSSVASPLNTHFLKKDTSGYIANQNIIESRGAIFDGGGSVIANGKIVYLYFPYAGTISKFTSICNAADATLTFDIFRLAFSAGNTLPTTSIIGAGNYLVPTTAEAQITPASWTSTQIVAGDVLAITTTHVASTAVWCNVAIDVTR